MARQTEGFMGGFVGRLGPAVGYLWRGKWCMRAHNPSPRNPRTEEQTRHREMFKREVQLASHMRWAVNLCFRDVAYEMEMTSYNLFVHLNQGAFGIEERRTVSPEEGERWEYYFRVDYSRLRLSTGPLARAAFGVPQWDGDNVVSVAFEKTDGNPRYGNHDNVYLYAYCPDLEEGYMAAPVYRKTRRISVALPDEYAGHEVHLYGMACNDQGEWSETAYVGCISYSSPLSSFGSPSPILGEEPESPVATEEQRTTAAESHRGGRNMGNPPTVP